MPINPRFENWTSSIPVTPTQPYKKKPIKEHYKPWRENWKQSKIIDLIDFLNTYNVTIWNIPLLTYIKYIKSHPEVLNQHDSQLWNYLMLKLSNTNLNRHSQIEHIHFSDIITKLIRIPFQYEHNIAIAPRKFFISYVYSGGIFWKLNPTKKLLDKLVWCPVSKMWWNKDHTTFLYSLSKKRTAKLYSRIGKLKSWPAHINECKSCERIWLKKHIKYNPLTEELTCITCANTTRTTPINLVQSLDTILLKYHGHNGKWKYNIQRQNNKDLSIPMGIELEMHLKSNIAGKRQIALWKLYQQQKEFNPLWENFIFEEDGSLGDAGVEMITNPMTLTFHQRFWELMLPLIRKNFSGWYAHKYGGGSNNYGIHITTNGIHWSDLNKARIGNFFTNKANQLFLQAIAQRAVLYGDISPLGNGNGHTMNQFIISNNNPKNISDIKANSPKKLFSLRRNQPVNIKQNGHVELRMFASTLNTGSFLKNLEFVDSFHKWTKETPYSINYGHYLAFLNDQNPQTYPNLMLYLSHNKFACKQVGTVVNKWKHLLKFNLIGQLQLLPDLPSVSQIDTELEDRAECV